MSDVVSVRAESKRIETIIQKCVANDQLATKPVGQGDESASRRNTHRQQFDAKDNQDAQR